MKAIIVGAGPAGLTAAYELLARTGMKPVVVEKSVYTVTTTLPGRAYTDLPRVKA